MIFHLGVHYRLKYLFTSIQNDNGLSVVCTLENIKQVNEILVHIAYANSEGALHKCNSSHSLRSSLIQPMDVDGGTDQTLHLQLIQKKRFNDLKRSNKVVDQKA